MGSQPAHSPFVCTRKETAAMVGPLVATWAWIHHSLPRTPVNVASKGTGSAWQGTMAASWPEGGIHWKQELRSVRPSLAVARSCTTVPCTAWWEAAHAVGPQDCLASGFQEAPWSRVTSTLAMAGPFVATLACTHHSLPRTPVKVA